jgi:hypothetical protein
MGPPAWADATTYPKDCQVRHNGVVYISNVEHTSSVANQPGTGTEWNVYNVPGDGNVTDILDNWATEYPQWSAQGFEIAGFVWWQGHKDGGEQGTGTAGLAATTYEQNLVKLIDTLRDYYEARYPANTVPDAPFVVATCGFGGGDWAAGSSADVIWNAQMAVGDPARHPGYAGNVASVDTTGYWRDAADSPINQGYHYNHNAETYTLVGDAAGRAMIDLQGGVTPPANTFANWIDDFPGVGTRDGLSDDADGDGIDNGVENYFGTDPSQSSEGLVSGDVVKGPVSSTFSFTHPLNASPADDLTASYRWSKDLATFHPANTAAEGTTVSFSQDPPSGGMVTVTATVTGTQLDRLFVDIQVTQD